MFQWLIDRRHRAFRENLSAYLDDQLPAPERQRLEDHLATCAACLGELEELRAVVEAVKSLPAAPVPRSFTIEPAALPRPAAAPRTSLAFGVLSAAALVVFAALLGSDLLTRPGGERTREEEAVSEAMAPAALEAREGAEPYEGGAPATAETFAPGAAAPAPTMAAPGEAPATPAPAPGEPEEEEAEATPLAAERAPAPGVEEEGGGGRTVLRALEVAFGGVFLVALGGAVWMRRRGGLR